MALLQAANLAIADHPDLALSKDVNDWILTCPDLKMLGTYLQHARMLSETKKCDECSEKFRVAEMRIDDFSAFPSGNLICQSCAECFCEPTMANPEGLKLGEEWKPYLPLSDITETRTGAVLRVRMKQSKKIIGTVTNYNPRAHTGFVSLDAFPDGAETGTLDYNCEVIDDDGNVLSQNWEKQEGHYFENPVFERSLADLIH